MGEEQPYCRFNRRWTCRHARTYQDREGFYVSPETCELCLRAKEITSRIETLRTMLQLPLDLNRALRTLNTYIYRLDKTLRKLEEEGGIKRE